MSAARALRPPKRSPWYIQVCTTPVCVDQRFSQVRQSGTHFPGAPGRASVGYLDNRRDWGHVEDAVDAMWRILRHDDSSVVNVGTGWGLTTRELAAVVRCAVGYSGTVAWDPSKPDGTPRHSPEGVGCLAADALGVGPQDLIGGGHSHNLPGFPHRTGAGALTAAERGLPSPFLPSPLTALSLLPIMDVWSVCGRRGIFRPPVPMDRRISD